MGWWRYASFNSNPSLTYLRLIENITASIKGERAASTLRGGPQEEEPGHQSAAEG